MYYVIFNPTAGAGRSVKTMRIVEQYLKDNNKDYKVAQTKYPKHATQLARDAIGKGYDGIISVGGDGTLLEIAESIRDTNEILGVVPAGTGNDFRQAIGVPKDTQKALDIILQANSKSIDIGLMDNGDCFLNVVGTGFDVQVLKNTNRVRKVLTGSAAYYLGIVMSILGYKNIDLEITANGKTIKRTVLLIVVANGKRFGGGLNVSPDSSVTDGLFNVVIINKVAKWRILGELPKLKRGELEKISCAERFMCSEIKIECDKSQQFDIDGEIFGQTPMAFTVKENALNVFCAK